MVHLSMDPKKPSAGCYWAQEKRTLIPLFGFGAEEDRSLPSKIAAINPRAHARYRFRGSLCCVTFIGMRSNQPTAGNRLNYSRPIFHRSQPAITRLESSRTARCPWVEIMNQADSRQSNACTSKPTSNRSQPVTCRTGEPLPIPRHRDVQPSKASGAYLDSVSWPHDVLRLTTSLSPAFLVVSPRRPASHQCCRRPSSGLSRNGIKSAPGLECKRLATDTERHRVRMLVRRAARRGVTQGTCDAGGEELQESSIRVMSAHTTGSTHA